MRSTRWQPGAAWAREAALAWLRGAREARALRDNPRRRLLRLDDPRGVLLIKQFRLATGRHAARERAKAWLGRSGADREWRALIRLHRGGAAVPEPLALGALPGGDRLLVERFVPGRPVAEALRAAPALRRRILVELGDAVARMHRAGVAHGDLHHGNVLVGNGGVTLLDFQHARRRGTQRARLRDLGWLDYSLAALLSTPDRVRLRAASLGLHPPFGAAARERLREVARASERRAREHARSRTRRAGRPGRRFARVRIGAARGLRCRELDEARLADLVRQHREALAGRDARVVKDDGRSRITAHALSDRRVMVKQVDPRGPARRIADGFRGSPARRAWRGGHGLLARGIGAALPLAFLERRRWGLASESLVVLEDLAPAAPADVLAAEGRDPGELLDALVRLAVALHRRGVDHGDLKASHVYLPPAGDPQGARLLDLEGVRFRRRLSASRRVRALSQLNASLPDAVPAGERRRAFARYARALPFRAGAERALRDVVALSLARRHRWSGADCALETPSGGERRPPTTSPG